MTRMPKRVGTLIDRYYEARAKRLEYKREVDARLKELREQEERFFNAIFEGFTKSDIEGARGKVATAAITREQYPQVEDWEETYDYIRNKGSREGPRFYMLARKLSTDAWRQLFMEGVLVPGTKAFTKIGLSVTKIPTRGGSTKVGKPKGTTSRRAK